jgi:phosphate transport system substrate-binding protein
MIERTRSRLAPLAWLLPLVLLLPGGCSRRANRLTSIQIKGSDTMVNLGQAWAEAFMKEHPDMSVAVTGGGSGTGIASLIAGSCDIAEVSRDMKNDEIALARRRGVEPRQITVALDGLAVVVHPANPVTRLTMGQLAQIFSGAITNWKDVGGADRQIVVLSREVNSGTHVYFKEHVLRRGRPDGKEEFSPGALLLPSSQAIADEVAQNPGAIGYYGMGYITPWQRALAVAMEPGAAFVMPTMDHVLDKSYPISRPLLMVSAGEPRGLTARFLDFILSSEGQKLVAKLDFVPIHG